MLNQKKLEELLRVGEKYDDPMDFVQRGGAVITRKRIKAFVNSIVALFGTVLLTANYSVLFQAVNDINSGQCSGFLHSVRVVSGTSASWCNAYTYLNTAIGASNLLGLVMMSVAAITAYSAAATTAKITYQRIENELTRAFEVSGFTIEEGSDDDDDIPMLENAPSIDGGRRRRSMSKSRKKSRSRSKSRKKSRSRSKSRSKSRSRSRTRSKSRKKSRSKRR